MCPERGRGFDGALSALASVTEVALTSDLQVAKVYLSIYSDDTGKAAAMAGLQRLEGCVRRGGGGGGAASAVHAGAAWGALRRPAECAFAVA